MDFRGVWPFLLWTTGDGTKIVGFAAGAVRMKSGFALFQLWLVGTAIWMIGWTILINSNCAPLPSGQLVCQPEFLSHLTALAGVRPATFVEFALCGLSVPTIVLIVGTVVFSLVGPTRPD
jgi:hypothetical protein